MKKSKRVVLCKIIDGIEVKYSNTEDGVMVFPEHLLGQFSLSKIYTNKFWKEMNKIYDDCFGFETWFSSHMDPEESWYVFFQLSPEEDSR